MFSFTVPPHLGQAVKLLLQAFDYAADAQTDVWQFAIELHDLQQEGMTISDLRWLLLRGFAEHALETTIPGDAERSFRPLSPTSLPKDACLVLTPRGASMLRLDIQPRINEQTAGNRSWAFPTDTVSSEGSPHDRKYIDSQESPESQRSPKQLPDWDPHLRELRYRGAVVKKYRVPASNQERILSAFQEDGWPQWVDDPLPPVPNIEPKRRLQATVKSLNRNQITPCLCFHVNQNGTIVSWEAIERKRG